MNTAKLAKAREAIEFARNLRTGRIPLVKWRGWAAQALAVAGEVRRSAWQPWTETVTIWVCQCCMLSHANGECCADDTHAGDSMIPLSGISPEDGVAMGMAASEHSKHCVALTRGASECDCAVIPFSSVQCDGCNSWLAGERHAMTLFVGELAGRTVSA